MGLPACPWPSLPTYSRFHAILPQETPRRVSEKPDKAETPIESGKTLPWSGYLTTTVFECSAPLTAAFSETVSFSVVECDKAPDVPVSVRVYDPSGVPGFRGRLEPPAPHETSIIPLVRTAASRAQRCGRSLSCLRHNLPTIAGDSPSNSTNSHIAGQETHMRSL